ncbi:MAG TPA: 3-keto-5-aminohexanoate cleavage protein [Thermomicrobiales bacterium]|nr:3-keto-5-aminohexanoate cleavage protein [Thermomicrobiales bacterium]HRA47351.1 3-keto-5-aminohexanoate cleavage protein [Thermomicrobiales bacterium]
MTAKRDKVIISCAVTGAVHVPSQSEYLPITPEQIAENAIGAAEAGAAILHLHARNPETGKPTPDPDMFMQFLPEIKERTDAVVNITTGGGQGMTLEQRLAAAMRAKPEMCSLNMGSMNFGRFQMGKRIKDWRFDWEQEDLEASRDYIFRNTYADITYILRELGEGHGVRFEFECYDVGHLYNLAYFLEEGLVKPPLFVQTIFGILGGIGTDPEDLMHMKRTADRLFGDQYQWSILGGGRQQFNLVTMGAIMGGNVRVGLEDNIYLGKGQLAKSNAELVGRTVRILNELSLDIATPEEARAMLALKGVHNVGF